jgi:hypothetical protein
VSIGVGLENWNRVIQLNGRLCVCCPHLCLEEQRNRATGAHRERRLPIEAELRALIRQMSRENLLWGAPRIDGELLKLGFELAQSSVAKYMVKQRGPPSQGWRTFLRNHAPDIAAMDLFVVPTIGFRMALS